MKKKNFFKSKTLVVVGTKVNSHTISICNTQLQLNEFELFPSSTYFDWNNSRIEKNELSRCCHITEKKIYVKLGLRLKSTLFTSSSLGIPESKLGFKKHTSTDQLDFFSYKSVDDTNIPYFCAFNPRVKVDKCILNSG